MPHLHIKLLQLIVLTWLIWLYQTDGLHSKGEMELSSLGANFVALSARLGKAAP
jgi:hypothetical protein